MQIGPNLTPSEPLQRYTHLKLALADELEWDNQGRVVLTGSILSRSKLGKGDEVTLIGSKDHLELWQRAKWLERKEQLIAESPVMVSLT